MSTSDSIVYGSTASDGKWAVNINGYASNSRDNSSTVINKSVLQNLLNLVEGLPENTLNKIDATTFVKRDGAGNVTVYDLKSGAEYSGSIIDIATLFTKTEGTDNRTVIFDPSAANNQILNSAYKYDYLVKNGSHSLKIKPIDLTILTEGSKIYGQNNDEIAYDYTYNGLKDFDTDDYDTYLKSNTTYTSSPESRITSASNAGTYGTQNGDGQKAINTSMQNTSSADYKNIANNYNIKFADTLTINKRKLAVNTEGSKTYGSINPTNGFTYTSNTGTSDNTTGLMSWDNALLKNSTTVVEGLDERSNAGVYGTKGEQTPNNKILNTTTVADLNKNYDITYTDKFTINKKDLTYAYTGTREYGRDNATGSYDDPTFSGLTNWDTVTSDDYTLSNEAGRTTKVDTYSDKLKVDLTGDVFKNYNISGTTSLDITKADFTYVADHSEYWQGQQIPQQNGRVYNSHGEDVSDLVGTETWTTSATRYSSPGYYEIIGSGSADSSGNYSIFQYGSTGAYNDFEPAFTDDRDNYTALKIKANQTMNYGEIYGPWGNYRKAQLDIRYLTSKSTEGINRNWSDSAQDKGTFTFIGNSQKK